MTRPAAGALLAVAALAAGCGGEKRLSKEEFVRQGDAICRDYNAKIGALRPPAAASDVPAYVDQANRELDLALARLRLLKPPKSASRDFDRLLALSDETRRVTDDLKAAAQSGDRQALRAASQRGEELDRREDEISRRLGLTECVHA